MALSVGAVNSLKVHVNAYRQNPTPESSVEFTVDGAVKSEQKPQVQSVPGAVYEPSSAREKAIDDALKNGVVYERSNATETKPATYSINRMSAEQRAQLVQQMREDAAKREQQFFDIVNRSLSEQNTAFGKSMNFSQLFATGRIRATAGEIAQARADVATDGYFGVNQTSARLFDFASALAGDDEGQMRRMQAAMQRGFNQAARAWGGSLPSISHDTLSAANKLFEDYYASKREQQALSA